MGYPSSLPPPPLGFEIFKSLSQSFLTRSEFSTPYLESHNWSRHLPHYFHGLWASGWLHFLKTFSFALTLLLVQHPRYPWLNNEQLWKFIQWKPGVFIISKKNCFINISNVYFDHFFMQGPVIKQIDWSWIMVTPTKCNCNGESGTSSLPGRQRRQPNRTLFYWEYGQKRNCTHHPLFWVTVPELK